MLLKRRVVAVFFSFVCCAVGISAFADALTSTTGSVSDGSASIPYRLFEPQVTSPTQKVPLILYLHGMGERGTDNSSQTTWMQNLAAKTSSGQYSAYVLAPQINTNMWFSNPGSSTMSEGMSLTMQALHQAMSNPNVDTSRIYITGVSMGSFGTWDILARQPSLFAAAIPMSGGGDTSTAAAVKNVPIWAFHGSADDVVGVDSTRNMIQAIKDAGGSPNYTEVAGGGHVIWPEMYADPNNSLYSWLFSQHLGDAPASLSSSDVAPADMSSAASVISLAAPVPEPVSVGLIALGGLAILRRGRRSRRATAL